MQRLTWWRHYGTELRVVGLLVLCLGAIAFVINWRHFFPPSMKDVTVVDMYLPGWMVESTLLKDNMEEYQALHPKVMVRLHALTGAGLERLEARWRSGKASGDLALVPSVRARQWAQAGLLAEWQGFFDMQMTPDSFLPAFRECGKVGGKQYLMPVLGQPALVAVRKGAPAYPGLRAGKLAVGAASYQPALVQAVSRGQGPVQAEQWCQARQGVAKPDYLLTLYPEQAGRLGPGATWTAPAAGQPSAVVVQGLVIPKSNRHYDLSVELAREYLMDPKLLGASRWPHGLPVLRRYYQEDKDKFPGNLLPTLERSLPAS